MHPLHDHLAESLAEKLKAKHVVVLYDPRAELRPFANELRGGPNQPGTLSPVLVGDVTAKLAEYAGSFFELRAAVEPVFAADTPEPLLVYVPGVAHDAKGSVLMELEKAGTCYESQLKRWARNLLAQHFTAGVIDDMLAPDSVTYEDLARQLASADQGEQPSILKAIFHDLSGGDILLFWLAHDSRDAEITAKHATAELAKLIESRLDLTLSESADVRKLRAATLRYVLGSEFRLDLGCAPPASLEGVPAPKTKEQEAAVRDVARRLRVQHADAYAELADRIEEELRLGDAGIAAKHLGSIDTFRFEEAALLSHCHGLIAEGQLDQALAVVAERERSFWRDRDPNRKLHWEVCRRMAELGSVARDVRASVAAAGKGVDTWVAAYVAAGGWHRLDQAQRRLETLVVSLDDQDERSLGLVRRAYDDACQAMATGFVSQLAAANWVLPTAAAQTRIFAELVAEGPKPVAYFLVDSLRFEMGMDLWARLPKTAEANIRPALASLPSITPVGMAALMPGAAGSFSVVEKNGRLGCRIDDAFLPDLPSRRKLASARVPGLVDMTLDDLLADGPGKLAKKVANAQVIVVRSQEIDQAGEAGFSIQARQVMELVIDNLARGVRKLAAAGVERSVITADHGHLFSWEDRDEHMRVDSPGGDEIALHRRCWIGRGGKTPAGCVRVSATALGYASDLELVFPPGCGVFRAGGSLAFHHGGPSLQEMVIPVITVRLSAPAAEKKGGAAIEASDVPAEITNRIFTVRLRMAGKLLALFANAPTVRALLVAANKHVGKVCLAIDATFDPATGCVTLQPNQPATVAFQLADDTVKSLRLVVQDPATDAELYRSPKDIPVRLGV